MAAAKADLQETDETETNVETETDQTQGEEQENTGTDVPQEESPSETEETTEAEIVDAAQGKKLLVVHFDLEGSPEEDVNCSFFEYGLKIRMKINEIGAVSALNTMIPNDLMSYMDVVPAGETVDTVIVAEIGEMTEQEIHDLTLQISSENGQSCTVKLK